MIYKKILFYGIVNDDFCFLVFIFVGIVMNLDSIWIILVLHVVIERLVAVIIIVRVANGSGLNRHWISDDGVIAISLEFSDDVLRSNAVIAVQNDITLFSDSGHKIEEGII